MDKLEAKDSASVKIMDGDSLKAKGMYNFRLLNPDGTLVYEEEGTLNTVPTQGKNYLLDNSLAGVAYTAALYVGLISSVGYTALAAADTAAQINGTNGWREAGPSYAPNYSESVRQTATFAAASGGIKAMASVASFTISGNGTLKGSFVSTSSVKDGTAGSLISEVLFSGGDQAVVIGQIAQISWSLQI